MTTARQRTGRRGEELAAERLRTLGWRLLETNWRCSAGELDIVARDGDWLVIVEVRTRRLGGFGAPEETVGWAKQRRLRMLGSRYVQSIGWSGPWRIDVVAIDLDESGRAARMEHYANISGA